MHSILFYIGPVPIRAYGLMLWIALIVGLFVSVRMARRTKIKSDHVVDVTLYSVLAGVVGAHLVSILLDLPYYLNDPSQILSLWQGMLSPSGGLRGLSFHGGLIGGIAAALLYTRKKNISFLAMADVCSPGLALAYGITRIGCFLNGCCYGIPTDLPWAVRFHEGMLPSHPTQIYALLANIGIFVILVILSSRSRFTGEVFVSYLALYSGYRFLIEFLRKGVTAEVAFAGLTQAQIVSLVVMAVAVPILVKRLNYPEPAAPKPKHKKGG